VSKPKVIGRRRAGRYHEVITAQGGETVYRREPCAECPWRVENAGNFPAEAFRHSANTAIDASTHTFACHMAGLEKPTVCAGFLLQNAANNLSVRFAVMEGRIDPAQISDGGAKLHSSYRAMAIANGVPRDDPAIAECRGNHDDARVRRRR
jgi:hypothetical protein